VTPIDQTTHFLRPASFDVLADARVVRIGRTTTFGRVLLVSATDRRPVGMVSSAYAML
jgi:acyl-coenzyme A thioesterase PaaI-like protein